MKWLVMLFPALHKQSLSSQYTILVSSEVWGQQCWECQPFTWFPKKKTAVVFSMKGSVVHFMVEDKQGTWHSIYFREGITTKFSRIPFTRSSEMNIRISFGDEVFSNWLAQAQDCSWWGTREGRSLWKKRFSFYHSLTKVRQYMEYYSAFPSGMLHISWE